MVSNKISLENVKKIGEKLKVTKPSAPSIMIGGTNGKGSTLITLESIYHAAGFSTGCFCSPYFFEPREQIRVNRKIIDQSILSHAFDIIEHYRENIPLSEFEKMVLAALIIFEECCTEIIILEVGLGGQDDAVNIVENDLSIITNIALDHTDFLGDTREDIAKIKSGIIKPHQIVIYGESNPPNSLLNKIKQEKATLYQLGKDFETPTQLLKRLPELKLYPENIACALKAIDCLNPRLPVEQNAIIEGLQSIHWPGRLQSIDAPVPQVLDVAHNPAACARLASELKKDQNQFESTIAVFSMYRDKDIQACLDKVKNQITEWHVAPLKNARSCSENELKEIFTKISIDKFEIYPEITMAYKTALDKAQTQLKSRVIVFGSFQTLAQALSKVPHFKV